MAEVPSSKTEESSSQIRGSSLLLAGRVFSLAANLVTQILLVHYLSKSDFGAFAFAISSIELIAYVSMLGLDKAAARFLPIYHERREFDRVLGAWLMCAATALATALLVAGAIFASRESLLGTVISSELPLSLLLILLALAPIEALDFIFEVFFGVFGNVKSVFFRRYMLRPGLKLIVAVAVIVFHGSIFDLTYSYLAASLVGFVYYIPALLKVFRQQDLFSAEHFHKLRFPVREVFGFAGSLLSSHFVFLCQGSVAILLLEAYSGSVAVGEFRAVLPFARLNVLVVMCFTLLYTPTAMRFLSRRQSEHLSDLHWDSTVWIVILTFPVLAMTTVFADPLTSLMLGEKYAPASVLMKVLAVGFFFEASLGMCMQTMRVYAKIKSIVLTDATATAISLGLFFFLIPRYDAFGAAIATTAFNIIAFSLSACFTNFSTDVKIFARRQLRLFGLVAVALVPLALIEYLFEPGVLIALLLVVTAWAGIGYFMRDDLALEQSFPELGRLLKAVRVS